MRLINTTDLTLTQFDNPESTPRYAILSHTWSEERDGEVSFQQFTTLPEATLAQGASKQGFTKIQQTCRLAREKGLEWAWVDTCCIDKTSSAELSEAINSMWRWYVGAEVCFAFLADLDLAGKTVVVEDCDRKGKSGTDKMVANKEPKEAQMAASADVVAGLGRCRWFTRGWTLQEMIAPRRLEFYNKDWEFYGEKRSMRTVLSQITSIRADVFRSPNLVPIISVAERMSWAATRRTKHMEDTAYCLLGIFDVNMPLLYGEGGQRAFARLQEEIIKESNDMSLFAWRMKPDKSASQTHWGIFAPSPREFAECAGIDALVDPMHRNECAITSKGLRVTPVPGGGLSPGSEGTGTYFMDLQCYRQWNSARQDLGILLQQQGCDVYTRVHPDRLYYTPPSRSWIERNRAFYVTKEISPSRSIMLRESIQGAIVLSRALETLLREWRIQPERTGAFEPEGHWDAQRKLFLTRGMRDFECRVKLTSDQPVWQIVLVCSMSRDTNKVLVRFENARPKRARGKAANRLQWEPRPYLVGAVTEGILDGQPVSVVDIFGV